MAGSIGSVSPEFTAGVYRSPATAPPLPARLFPSLAFFLRSAGIVRRSARLAGRGGYDDAAWARSSLAIMRALEAVGVRFEIEGVENFASLSSPCVFAGNHMSTLETFILPTLIMSAKRVTFVVKQSLLDYPVFGHVMRSRDPVVVGRSNPREDLKAVLEGGAARLAAGISIVVFPQKTRMVTFDPSGFNSIGIKLAKRAGVPVVPVALKTDAWGNGPLVKDLGKIDPAKTVHIEFGPPLCIAGNGGAEQRQLVEFIRGRLLSWGAEVADDQAGTGA